MNTQWTARLASLGTASVIGALLVGGCSSGGSGSGGGGGNGGGVVTPPATTPAISGLSLTPTSLVGGAAAQGTVTLNAAPTVGTAVTLLSNNAAATVPGSVTVNSSATTATFPITTTTVPASLGVTITGTLNGSQTATLTIGPVPPPPFAANFVVRSLTAALRKTNGSTTTPVANRGAGSLDTCPLVAVNGNPQLSCEFDGGGSTSPNGITDYRFTWKVGNNNQDSQSNKESKFQPKVSNCGFFAGQSDGGFQLINMVVTLVITDNSNNKSATTTNQNVAVFPAGLCGYSF